MTSRLTTLCLNMIVRDEAHVIRRCLTSVRPLIDYWVIVDTGSRDGTQEAIRNALDGIPGELIERPWKDFSHNRNEALHHAQGKADYLLFIDADEVLHVEDTFHPASLQADAYLAEMRILNNSYLRRQVVRDGLPWRYVGVLHEYLDCDVAIHEERLLGLYTRAIPDGARSQNRHKYRQDALVLEQALLGEPQNSRYVYYLAQSYLCDGDLENAIKFFSRSIEMNGSPTEVSAARYHLACCMELSGQPWPEVMHAFLLAFEKDPLRAEPLYRIGLHFQKKRDFSLAHLFLSRAMKIPQPDLISVSTCETDVYRWLLPIEYAVSCYWIGDVDTAREVNERLLQTEDLPNPLRSMVVRNQGFCQPTLYVSQNMAASSPSAPVVTTVRGDRSRKVDWKPTISCLTATLDRWDLLQESIHCYCAQSWPNKELLIATEGSQEYKHRIQSHLDQLGRHDIRLIDLEGEQTLGSVRNTLLDAASGDLICQWDDDDLNHPERLRAQAEHLLSQGADACFFQDQLQWFRETGELYWIDWAQSRRTGAATLIPGTVMMWSDLSVRYPEEGEYSQRGEDTILMELLCAQFSVTGFRGQGFLSIYTYHGANTFDLNHHRQIASLRGTDRTFLETHRQVLQGALDAYPIPLSPLSIRTRYQEEVDLRADADRTDPAFSSTASKQPRRVILIFNRMFGATPDLGGLDGTEHYEWTEDRSRFDEAVAVIFHIPDLPNIEQQHKRPGQLWVGWWMECEVNYPQLKDERFMGKFDLHMGYPLQSDISVTYVPSTLYEGEVGLGHPKSSKRLTCSFISGYVDNSGRSEYLRELSRHMEVHFYGRKGNRELLNDQGRHTKLSVVGSYKFDLAFENSLARDYVTEKFFDPLVAGTVPVYMGAENIIDFAPTDHCFIDVRNFANPADLASHLLELDRDDEAYRRLLSWRSQPPRPGFPELFTLATSNPFQRLCRKLDDIWKRREVRHESQLETSAISG